jgi:hypothetical protein
MAVPPPPTPGLANVERTKVSYRPPTHHLQQAVPVGISQFPLDARDDGVFHVRVSAEQPLVMPSVASIAVRSAGAS